MTHCKGFWKLIQWFFNSLETFEEEKKKVWYVINSVCIVSCLLIIYALGKLNRFEGKNSTVNWNENLFDLPIAPPL